MKNLKKLTILHSNDMHGDFMAEKVDEKLLGGVSFLSGFVNSVRKKEKNVLYAVSGDMLRGSVIDSEYKGISTIEIMNMLAPDVATIGNHEADYGVAHLLFLEKCASFPIINANMYLTNGVRLFNPHIVIEKDGMKILFIGVLTEDVIAMTKKEQLIGELVEVRDPAEEIGKICNAYGAEDIDLTVLLTHIGFEDDKRLAEELDPAWGVDLIIGGHSHTMLTEPCVVNGIPIVQAASGTDWIGRFDIIVDTDRNAVDSYKWQLIPVDAEHCPRDYQLEKIVTDYKNKTDIKYERVVTRLEDCCTHPARNEETTLGRLISDAFREALDLDIMFLGSGGIRADSLGPIVRYKDLLQVYPYNDPIYRVFVTGEQLVRMVKHVLRKEAFTERTEFYQFSKGFYIEYDLSVEEIVKISLDGQEIVPGGYYKIGLEVYHFLNLKEFLDIEPEEVQKHQEPKVVATSSFDVLEEYFSGRKLVKVSEERRLVI